MLTEAEKKMHRCCFTGHRPEKLSVPEKTIIKQLKREIAAAIDRGYTTFISGMSRGTDIWAAECVIKLKRHDDRLRLICALPFPEFGQNWSREWRDRFDYVIKRADLVKTVSQSFSYQSFQKRNEWMVTHSGLIIAVFNGSSGGTYNTLEYAKHLDKEIRIIES